MSDGLQLNRKVHFYGELLDACVRSLRRSSFSFQAYQNEVFLDNCILMLWSLQSSCGRAKNLLWYWTTP